jgi:short-subunit dehydrogenase
VELGFKGKSVLITGSSKGIGLACAKAFASEGCNVHLVARTGAALDAASNAIRSQYQVTVTTHALDLSDSKNIDSLVTDVGTIDILVNNAGAIPGGPIETVDEAAWRTSWDLKVYGYINMTRVFLARMTERGRGAIINIIATGGEKLDYNYIAGLLATRP